MSQSQTAARLRRVLPDDVVVDDPDRLASYSRDQSQFTAAEAPAAVVIPRSKDHVISTLRFAHECGVSVVPRGLGSGLSGGANAMHDSIVLSLHRLTEIVRIDQVNRLAVVQPGVITGDLRKAVTEVGLFYPPDPGSVEFCTVGGNIATNAGGMCCVKYGVTGDFVLGLEVILADGRVVRTGTETIKGVAGYDLTRLFVGSEGTLGVITEATLRLLPTPLDAHTLVASFGSTAGAGRCVAAIASSGMVPSLMELLDRVTVQAVDDMTHMGIGADVAALLLVQFDAVDAATAIVETRELCVANDAIDVIVSEDPSEGFALLEARRLALPALERLGDWLLDDVAVPISRITALLQSIEHISRKTGLTIGVFGHAGDGNFHPTVIFDAAVPESVRLAQCAFAAITQSALDLGGTVTGEHGIGQLKREWLKAEVGPDSLAVQRAIKDALDPKGILNPSKVL